MFTLRTYVETLIPRLCGRKKFFQVIYENKEKKKEKKRINKKKKRIEEVHNELLPNSEDFKTSIYVELFQKEKVRF